MELIDTLWNVNRVVKIDLILCIRINRYIMECKSCWCWGGFGWCSELIDTLWNVNTNYEERLNALERN